MVKKVGEDGQESRERILAAAQAEFAEKGFDGARVDEISRRAQVNKALIYYYFGSKQKLMEELLRSFLQERRRQLVDGSEPDRQGRRDLPDRVAMQDIDFLEAHRDILRVVLMEDIKASSSPAGKLALFEHWLEGLEPVREFYAKRGYPFRYTPRVVAALYFQHLVPSLVFAAMGQAVADRLGVDHGMLREEFLRLTQELTKSQFESVFGSSNADPSPEIRGSAEDGRGKRAPSAPQAHIAFDPAEREALLAKILRGGRVARFPLQEKARVALVEHLSGLFQSGRTYTEREVRGVLEAVVEDHAKARRYLVDYGYLARRDDGSAYWVP